MGLAASQARFLGLTARKSNTEYEGQQVNQQRTTLANESASLYNQLTNLTVPTPPDIINYYTTEYSFNYKNNTYTLAALPIKDDKDSYTVSLSFNKEVPGYRTVTADGIVVPSEANTRKMSDLEDLQKHIYAETNERPNDDADVLTFAYNGNTYYSFNDKFYLFAPTTQLQTKTYTGVKLEYTNAGEIKSLNFKDAKGASDDDKFGNEDYAVSATQVADNNAYDLAMNAYNKAYSEYEKTMAQINAKTEVLQQQDKSLELRLNQLDTEQQALSTEMDAVQKVIDKNVETTFKTFG